MATADPHELRMMAEAWGEDIFPTPPEDRRPKDAAAAYVLRRMAVPHLLACADEIEHLRGAIEAHRSVVNAGQSNRAIAEADQALYAALGPDE